MVVNRHSRRPRAGRKASLFVLALVAATGIALLVAGLSGVGEDAMSEMAFERMARDYAGGGEVDWDGLASEAPHSTAWLRVDGTPVDYPVMRATEDDPEFWLTHDPDGNETFAGSLFTDWRSDPDGRAVLVYGHHMGTTGRMFSPIYARFRQSEFDGLTTAEWSTPRGGTTTLRPLCAMSVDKSYQPVQRFDFKDDDDFRSWLNSLLTDSTARSPEAESLVASANRAVTLVTCSSPKSGQRARTLVVFVA